MAEVTINSEEYNSYSTVAAADTYLNASLGAAADAWRAADADTKGRGLVTATRWLDGQTWLGEPTDPDQDFAFPRTGIDGLEDDETPDELVQASQELAAALVEDPDLRTTLSETKLQSMSAGSVSLTYFRGESVEVSTPFPSIIMDLIGQWLTTTGIAGGLGVYTSGTCAENPLNDPYGFNEGM